MLDWTLQPINQFHKFKEDWDALNNNNSNTPLLDTRFVIPLLENFATGDELLAICTTNSATCALVILEKTRFGCWQTFQPSQAPIGCWLQDVKVATETLGRSLRQALPGGWLLLGITQQDPSFLPRPGHSRTLNTIDYIATARVAVEGTFEEYWAKRGKNLRQNLRRQRNRLARENVVTKLVIITDKQEMADSVEAYGTIESAGWKSESNTAINIDNAQGRFYNSMLQNFAEAGQAMVLQYHYDQKLVATDLCITGGDNLVILKTTYDEEISTSSPAMLMREDAFNHIFTEKIAKRIEFYGKVMEWHTKWAEDIRTMYHINIFSLPGSMLNIIMNSRRISNQ